jgi:anti-sigma-K factor RskA
MRKASGPLAQALAAEYVLGTLRGRARRRFEAMFTADPALRGVVERWEAELVPLAEDLPPVEPPARVWREIESRIAAPGPALRSFWGSLAFWRGFGIVSGALASVLLAFFLYISTGPRGEPVFVAVLTAADAEPHLVVSMHQPDLLRIRMVKPWTDTGGKSLELWVVPKEGAPRSLGVVPNQMGDTLITITTTDPRVRGANALAVTLEPPGGAPGGKATGPVVASGSIAPVRRS